MPTRYHAPHTLTQKKRTANPLNSAVQQTHSSHYMKKNSKQVF